MSGGRDNTGLRATERAHYSYSHYADPETARSFDARRFGGPIGAIVAEAQARLLHDAIAPASKPTVLDVGTGTGRAALPLARAGARVTGVDASEEMLNVARARAAADAVNVTFRLGDAHALDVGDRSFDVVVCLRVIMHTPHWRTTVGEICRAADRLLVLDFPSAYSAALVESLARRVGHRLGRRTEPYRVFRPAAIVRALEEEGFQVRDVHRQFVLPIALHKAIGSATLTARMEGVLARVGLLRLVGSPITFVAERCES